MLRSFLIGDTSFSLSGLSECCSSHVTDVFYVCPFKVVGDSFNSLSVDSDQSTSDTVVLLSSGKVSFDENDEAQVNEGDRLEGGRWHTHAQKCVLFRNTK